VTINSFQTCDTIWCHGTFSFMLSLQAMSFGDRFCMSRKSGRVGGGWVVPQGEINTAVSVLCCKRPLVGGQLHQVNWHFLRNLIFVRYYIHISVLSCVLNCFMLLSLLVSLLFADLLPHLVSRVH